MPSEKSIQAAIVRALEKIPGCRCEVRHGNATSRAGEADIFGCLNGQHFELEVKQPGEKARKLQLHRLEQWRKAGAIAGVVTSVDAALEMLGQKCSARNARPEMLGQKCSATSESGGEESG